MLHYVFLLFLFISVNLFKDKGSSLQTGVELMWFLKENVINWPVGYAWSDIPPAESVHAPARYSKTNKQPTKKLLLWTRLHTRAHTRTRTPSSLNVDLCCSPQLLPSCPESAVTTGTERRWHPGSLSPSSAWKRSWIAVGPSVSGTRCRPWSSSCTLLASTKTVSDLHLWSPSHSSPPSRRYRAFRLFITVNGNSPGTLWGKLLYLLCVCVLVCWSVNSSTLASTEPLDFVLSASFFSKSALKKHLNSFQKSNLTSIAT